MSETSKTRTQAQAKAAEKSAEAKSAEIPQSAQEMTDRAVDQAKVTFERANDAANESVKVFDKAATAFADGTSEFQTKAIQMAQANLNAGFEHTRKLLTAKDAGEALELQQAFLRDQTQAVARQLQELSTLSIKLAETTAKPMQDGVMRSFDEMRKTFAA